MLTKHFVTLPLTFEASQLESCHAAYLEAGSGIPLLMLHGFFGEACCWLPLMEKLQKHFRCISLDLLGFGESSKPDISYDIAKEVTFVRQFAEKLEVEHFYILGHSFGSWVASAYALKFPKCVRSLILAAPAGIRDDSFCGRYDALRPLLWENPLVDLALLLATPGAVILGKQAEIERVWEFRKNLITQPVARSFLLNRLRPEDAVDTVEKEIYQLRLPTLVIAGELDETIPLWHSQTYAQEIPNARLAIIPGADHGLPQAYAGEMATLIEEFLGEVQVGTFRNASI